MRDVQRATVLVLEDEARLRAPVHRFHKACGAEDVQALVAPGGEGGRVAVVANHAGEAVNWSLMMRRMLGGICTSKWICFIE